MTDDHSSSTRFTPIAYVLSAVGAVLMVLLIAYADRHTPKSRHATTPGVHGLEWVPGPLETPLAVASLGTLALGVFGGAVHAVRAKGLPRRFMPLVATGLVFVATAGIGMVAYVYVVVLELGM